MERPVAHIKVKYSIILAIQLLLWLFGALFENHLFIHTLLSVCLVMTFAIIILVLWPYRLLKIAAICSGAVSIIGSFAWLIPHITEM